MAFISNDIYATSAGTELYNYWNPFVTKFDSQSFYNFEQDNQPLYDLEERTFELWGKATGYATSSLFGMPLVVSGAIPDVAGGDTANRNVFTNLQDALDALPNVIRTPTLIEVAASGLLGGISLKNVDIVEGGILEIVNRGFAKIYSGGGASHGGGNGVTTSSFGKNSTNVNTKNAGLMTLITSLDLSATITDTSALSVCENVSSLFRTGYTRAFTQLIGLTSSRMRTDKVSCSFVDPAIVSPGLTTPTSQFITGGDPVAYTNTFFMTNYEANSFGATGQLVDATIEFQDVSSVRGAPVGTGVQPEPNGANDYLVRSKIQAADDDREITGMVYANSVSSIEIKNCNGPLYVRGFCVDAVSGGTAAQYTGADWHANVGIEVTNSNATIENCSVMRAKTVGAKFVNSDVTLSRGFFSYRNYQLPSPSTARGGQETAGIHAINSRIDLQINPTYASGADYAFNTQHHDYGLILENSVLTGGQAAPFSYFAGTDLAFSYNKTGIKATNSVIDLKGTLDVYNNQTGLDLVNTALSTDRLTVENNQLTGLKAESSVVKYGNRQVRELYGNDQNGFRLAQTLFNRNGVHLDLSKNSTFTYSHDASTLDIPNKYGALRFHDSHGISNYVADITASASLPAISVNNSTADLLHPRIICSGISVAGPGVIGAAVKAENSAEVNFLGTINNATIVQGNGSINPGILAIAAINSSKLNFRGPTLVADFYNDIAANHNSTIEFTPHRDSNSIVDVSGFNLGNKTENHTSVELHNTGGVCVAVTEGSRLLMEDLGSPLDTIYKEGGGPGGVDHFWGASATFVDPDYLVVNTSAFTKGGSVQFYPNPPFGDYLGTTTTTTTNLLGGQGFLPDAVNGADDNMTAGTQGQTPYNYYLTNYFGVPGTVKTTINNNLSVGGFCVKIFSNSTGNVNNVNFPCGWTNADGSYFDSSATDKGCNQLRIWNVGGNSNLYAAHTSVCATQPFYCSGYHGPRAVFLSGTTTEAGSGIFDGEGENFAYAAGFPPRRNSVAEADYRNAVGTPDTSSLSILDWFGKGGGPVSAGFFSEDITSIQESLTGSGGTFGRLGAENLGPFRLFFDVDPCMRFVGYVSGPPAGVGDDPGFAVGDTKPYQHLAQGYSLSGCAGVSPNYGNVTEIGSFYPKLCQPTGSFIAGVGTVGGAQRASWGLEASGYYYASAMLQEHDPGSHVYLDENSANLFANAKNCSMPAFSGRAAPRVSVYRSTTIPWGGIGYAGRDATVTIGPSSDKISLGTMRGLQFWDPRRLV